MKRSTAKRSKKPTKYKARPRDTAYMLAVKRLVCIVPIIGCDWTSKRTPCGGAVEADHMGERAVGRKADDTTCVAMCTNHHRERTDHSGMFRSASQADLRRWRERAIAITAITVANMLCGVALRYEIGVLESPTEVF
jgi:hypothetical protein